MSWLTLALLIWFALQLPAGVAVGKYLKARASRLIGAHLIGMTLLLRSLATLSGARSRPSHFPLSSP